ncbi:ferritin-like domain-containing protein [Nocardia cyriacigeorgica]|uniref:ferritin-like domain-containing protein n=1 Tax=Nocardia cyriacigeorgica TaxID=135487 RepID=UPI0018955A6E|nr:ferritin-like domain-containing protein [Nocardia cyriacigeorgica]MBF6398637.1 ferritin-like domain-containing protein [Nocardia cyriacigeorgica]MBF6403849.1 ferritin-like domain-containing protein [Nocardia cyriacigeorgica]
MAFNFDDMLTKIKARQWALADIDWDAPGAEEIDAELWAKLQPFMADLMWIENVGARGFAAMAKKAPTDTLKEIYRYFHAEEQRHANAELALMRRWGMLDGDDLPEPNINVKLVIDFLDKHADDMSLSFLGTVIPMLEVALDGALIKFVTDEIKDPVAQEVFRKINADESRHLATDYGVMELLGHATARKLAIDFIGGWAKPSLIVGALSYFPLLNKMRDNIVEMGVSEDKLYAAMARFKAVGERTPIVNRLPMYRLVKMHSDWVINRDHPYHLFADALVKVTGRIPERYFAEQPTWSKALTHEPVA